MKNLNEMTEAVGELRRLPPGRQRSEATAELRVEALAAIREYSTDSFARKLAEVMTHGIADALNGTPADRCPGCRSTEPGRRNEVMVGAACDHPWHEAARR